MTTVVVLNIKDLPTYGRGRPPAYGIADIIPIPSAKGWVGQAIRGRVLNLQDRSSLAEVIPVAAGSYTVQVKLPSGDVLLQTVKVSNQARDTSISFTTDLPEREPFLARVRNQAGMSSEHAASSALLEGPRYAGSWFPITLGVQARVRLGESFFSQLGELRELRDYPGLVRLETTTSSEVFHQFERADAQSSEVASALFGVPKRIQVTQITGPKSRRYGQWITPMRGTDSQTVHARRRLRYFAALDGHTLGSTSRLVACVPGRWSLLKGKESATIRATVLASEEGEGRIRLMVEVEDPSITDVLDFMQVGDASAAATLIGPALDLLFVKQSNPFAAAAGGYAILFSKELAKHDQWPGWIRNLANWFPGLPDGMILYGTLLLQTNLDPDSEAVTNGRERSKKQRAYDATMEALRRGPPLYRQGLGLLATNLSILQSMFADAPETIEVLVKAAAAVHQWRLRVDPNQPFCVFNLRGLAI